MKNTNRGFKPGDTQPTKTAGKPILGDTQPIKPAKPAPQAQRQERFSILAVGVIFISLLGIATIISALAGYQSARLAQKNQVLAQAGTSMDEQYELGLQDMQAVVMRSPCNVLNISYRFPPTTPALPKNWPK